MVALLITIFDPPARCGVGQRSCVALWQWYNADLTLPCKSNTEHGFLFENIFFKSPMPTMLWAKDLLDVFSAMENVTGST